MQGFERLNRDDYGRGSLFCKRCADRKDDQGR